MKQVWAHYDQQVVKNEVTGRWIVPQTQDLANQLDWFDWARMIHDENLHNHDLGIVTIMPTYYLDECDWNHFDKPRLDLLLTLDNGEQVRYHRKCKNIWLPEDPRDDAIALRRKRLQHLRRDYGRDWER